MHACEDQELYEIVTDRNKQKKEYAKSESLKVSHVKVKSQVGDMSKVSWGKECLILYQPINNLCGKEENRYHLCAARIRKFLSGHPG